MVAVEATFLNLVFFIFGKTACKVAVATSTDAIILSAPINTTTQNLYDR